MGLLLTDPAGYVAMSCDKKALRYYGGATTFSWFYAKCPECHLSQVGRLLTDEIQYPLLYAEDQLIIEEEYEDMEYMTRKLIKI